MNKFIFSTDRRFRIALLSLCGFAVQVAQAQEGNERLEINAATLSAAGKELGAASEQDALANVLKIEKQLVYQVLEQAGINPAGLPAEVKAEIDKPQTKSLKAFLAFAKGLDAMDKGRYAEAEALFNEAVRLDPNFAMAERLRDAVPREQATAAQIASAEIKAASSKDSVAPMQTPQDAPLQPPSSERSAAEDATSQLTSVATIQQSQDIANKTSDQKGQVEIDDLQNNVALVAAIRAEASAAAQSAAAASSASSSANTSKTSADTSASIVSQEQGSLAVQASSTSAGEAARAADVAAADARNAANAAATANNLARQAVTVTDPASLATLLDQARTAASAAQSAAADAEAKAIQAQAAALETAVTRTEGYYAAHIGTNSTIFQGPYINVSGGLGLKKNISVDLPQQQLGCAQSATGVCPTGGSLTLTTDSSAHINHAQNNLVNVGLDRTTLTSLASVEAGYYSQTNTPNSFLWFAEGVVT
jgi:trimeric autotransporter adhesin